MTAPHLLNIYEKPKQGSALITRYNTVDYKHTILAVGGFDKASCQVLVPVNRAELFLERFLGNRVSVVVDNPFEPVFEGLITRISVVIGGSRLTFSLDEMVNQIVSVASSTASRRRRGPVDVADSQAVYGIKAGVFDGGGIEMNDANTDSELDNLNSAMSAFVAWPHVSITDDSAQAAVKLDISGFYHTLNWESVNRTTTGKGQATTVIQNVLTNNIDNGSTFFDNADFGDIASNTTQVKQKATTGTVWQYLQSLQELGDATDQWILGITPSLFNTQSRRLYYKPADFEIAYTARVADGMRIRNKWGRLIPPWQVRPDHGVKIVDALVGWNLPGDNPTEAYITGVRYEAEQQRVRLQTTDDLSLEGVFHLNRYFKRQDVRFGAPRREQNN